MELTEKEYKLTLASHPGKALVMKDKADKDKDGFTIGNPDQALEVTLKYEKGGYCAIRYKRHNGKDGHAFDCQKSKSHKFHEGDNILGCKP